MAKLEMCACDICGKTYGLQVVEVSIMRKDGIRVYLTLRVFSADPEVAPPGQYIDACPGCITHICACIAKKGESPCAIKTV